MSTVAVDAGLAAARTESRAHRAVRRRRYLAGAATAVLSLAILVWTILPIYNMVLISLEPEGDVFTDHIWPRVISTWDWFPPSSICATRRIRWCPASPLRQSAASSRSRSIRRVRYATCDPS